MASVHYNLGTPIPLAPLIAAAPGAAIALPATITATAGLYIILNQNNPLENRYMGIATDLRNRFAARQGACFELGFPQGVLNNVYAYLGTMQYQNAGAGWTPAPGYAVSNLIISLDGQNYDLEQLFIKAVQYAWHSGTITNTLKTGALKNNGPLPINVTISWGPPAAANSVTVTLPSGSVWN